jgi:hypothetical protein
MSISAFLQAVCQPTRWWRRHRTIQVTIWPQWLAQRLCPHLKTHTIMWDTEGKTITSICYDCYKHIKTPNPCPHGEVRTHAVETINIVPGRRSAQLAVRSYKCEHCGVELEPKDLPVGVKITHLNTGGEIL